MAEPRTPENRPRTDRPQDIEREMKRHQINDEELREGAPRPRGGGFDINLCSVGELAEMEHITYRTADQIVRYRELHGGRIDSLESLRGVPGVNDQVLETLRRKGAD